MSAYALIVEEGTQLARRIRRGEVPMTDDDVHADRYLIADEVLSAAGFDWYEVSNWATSEAGRCLHNELYWRGADWWGAGPGAHSHVGGVRWWNVKHPGAYAAALAAGRSPGAGRELLPRRTAAWSGSCWSCGCSRAVRCRCSPEPVSRRPAGRWRRGSSGRARTRTGRAVLTLRGRLLADAVVRDLVD